MHGCNKHGYSQESSTQTTSKGVANNSRSYCESLISTLLETDTYQFAKTIDSLQGIEETEHHNMCRKHYINKRPVVEKNIKPNKQSNVNTIIANTILDAKSDSSLTQTSYKSCPKEKLYMTTSRVKTCYQRISPLLRNIPNQTTSIQKETKPPPNEPLSNLDIISTLNNACQSKKVNISKLELKKQPMAQHLKYFETKIGDLASLDVNNVNDLVQSRRTLGLVIDQLNKESYELKLDVLSYKEILKDEHPTQSLLSLIKSGLVDEYSRKKAAFCNKHAGPSNG